MKLPNGANAIVEIAKLRDYVLSQSHPRGRHKARVFLAALDLSAAEAEVLQSALLESAKTDDAVIGLTDGFGARYTVDFVLVRATKQARVRGSWIIRADEGLPRLTSCYVL